MPEIFNKIIKGWEDYKKSNKKIKKGPNEL